MAEPVPERFRVQAVWEEPQVALQPADQAIVQFLGTSVILTIGQTRWPLLTSGEDPRIAAVKEQGLPVDVVSRFILTPDAAAKFAKAFRSLETFLANVPLDEDED